jgi:hypothetical protein
VTAKYPPAAPSHLSLSSRALWRRVLGEASFRLQAHHLEQLMIFCEARDRAAECRKVLKVEPAFTKGRPHGALAIEREAQRTALRALATLDLDAVTPVEKPGLKLASGVFR